MPLTTPTLTQLVSRVRADLLAELPELDPSIPASFLQAMVSSIAIRINAANLVVNQGVLEAYPQTATGENLERFAEGVSRNAASGSSGSIVVTGASLSTLPVNSPFASSSSLIYRTREAVVLANQIINVSSLSSSSGTATAIAEGHSISSGQMITISGAVDDAYNGSFVVSVIDGNSFSYPIALNVNSPTSGSIAASYVGSLVDVSSEAVGVGTNLSSGDRLSLSSPVSGIDDTALVRFDAITGGADIEDDESLRARIIEFRSAIRANFSEDTIVLRAKAVSGVTRVSVRAATPDPGDVTVHFVRDNDANIIPSSVDVLAVRDRLLEIIPGTMLDESLIVSAPTPVAQNFTFNTIAPNTQEMRDALMETLVAFFRDQSEIGVSIPEDTYRAAITQTIAGDVALASFTLTTPTSSISINADQIGVLGNVTFP